MAGRRALAAAQTIPRRGDVEANIAAHTALVRAAATEQVRLAVFPELSLTGYELELARDLAFTQADPRLKPLADLAAAHAMTLVVGAPVRVGERLHIGAFILSPDRSIDVYTKRRMGAFTPDASPDGMVPPPEASVFAPGDRDPLVRFDGNTAAVAVCADIGLAGHAENAAARGAGIYLASMFVVPADFRQERERLRTYAARHSMAVVFANYGGPSGGLPSAGRSAILSERGEVLTELGETGAGLVVAIDEGAGWRAETISLVSV